MLPNSLSFHYADVENPKITLRLTELSKKNGLHYQTSKKRKNETVHNKAYVFAKSGEVLARLEESKYTKVLPRFEELKTGKVSVRFSKKIDKV